MCLWWAFNAHYPLIKAGYKAEQKAHAHAHVAQTVGGTLAQMQDAVTAITADHAPGRSQGGERLRLIWRNIFPFVVVGAIWEIIAWSGIFPRRLFPTLEDVAASSACLP